MLGRVVKFLTSAERHAITANWSNGRFGLHAICGFMTLGEAEKYAVTLTGNRCDVLCCHIHNCANRLLSYKSVARLGTVVTPIQKHVAARTV